MKNYHITKENKDSSVLWTIYKDDIDPIINKIIISRHTVLSKVNSDSIIVPDRNLIKFDISFNEKIAQNSQKIFNEKYSYNSKKKLQRLSAINDRDLQFKVKALCDLFDAIDSIDPLPFKAYFEITDIIEPFRKLLAHKLLKDEKHRQ